MQVYRGLPILTNQPSPGELAAVPHHLVGVWPLEHAGSVAEFGRLAHAAVDDVIARGRRPVWPGAAGSTCGRRSLSCGPGRSRQRARGNGSPRFTTAEPQVAYQRLREVDPAAAEAVHPNDRRRVVRGLELHAAGTSLAPASDSLWGAPTRVPTVIVGLDLPPSVGDRRIARAPGDVRARCGGGGAHRPGDHVFSHTAARIHGLQDVTALLDGEIDRDEAVPPADHCAPAGTPSASARGCAGWQTSSCWMPTARPGRRGRRGGAAVVSHRRESDAVREARDAFVIVAACAPIALVISALVGTAGGQVILWQQRVTAPVVVAALLLAHARLRSWCWPTGPAAR